MRGSTVRGAAQEVELAQRHALVAQQGVRDGDVEIEVRQQEGAHVVGAGELQLPLAGIEADLARLLACDRVGRNAAQIFDRGRDTRLQRVQRGFLVRERGRLAARQPRGAELVSLARCTWPAKLSMSGAKRACTSSPASIPVSPAWAMAMSIWWERFSSALTSAGTEMSYKERVMASIFVVIVRHYPPAPAVE
jgi:hypothetical protein